MTAMRIAVVGAGWTGATAARVLSDEGHRVVVFETAATPGGHSRTEVLNGVIYEPNGAHIFHTSNSEVASFVGRFGLTRPYEHRVATSVRLPGDDQPRLLSWPPQVDELQKLPIWKRVERDLENLPEVPGGDNFEEHAISLMGPTLYEIFIRGYTEKQWGMAPSNLSSSIAPKRVELRSDGYTRLFRDRWEFFPEEGMSSVLGSLVSGLDVRYGCTLTAHDLDPLAEDFERVILTAPLDAFLERDGELAWRGIRIEPQFIPSVREANTATARYVINQPDPGVPYTRTVETKHATGQQVRGTVVGFEYPGAGQRHYPVPTPDRRYERGNEKLKEEIRERSRVPVIFAGRLANYSYINQDQAVEQGMSAAAAAMEET